ncbi:fungal-specific transcription factor domain-containing protein [Plectosphaerella cucumerina]|uniref:Fungal-specific transcription factor domain-containing protein n=1 Tax=Plectosphaerella cucumerina TaxID=40658 RepID=A0A8K0TGX1_9PEZI|nr:fungal-specific transcription factor domain-containing protein [Plectosphaerella cucumerina]
MPSQRVRVVQGSCWPCKKRRVKCDLAKPVCQRCVAAGASCDYNTRLIRWSTRPSVALADASALTSSGGGAVTSPGAASVTFAAAASRAMRTIQRPLVNDEQRALGYFQGRVWPLLTTVPDPCAPPTPFAMQHRVVMLSMCVFAASHRYLQDGRGEELITPARSECLQVLRAHVDGVCNKRSDMLPTLLFAVLLLYLHDGFVEGSATSATLKHSHGVLAILAQLGGLPAVIGRGHESMDMLLSEFASTDLTTALLQERTPAFAPDLWPIIDKSSVWWGRDPLGRCSLAAVFEDMAALAIYHDELRSGVEILSVDRVRDFELRLQPIYAPLTPEDLDGTGTGSPETTTSSPPSTPAPGDIEAVEAFKLVRAFQQTALIYMYRVVCGLSAYHPLVQQHVDSCLDGLFEVPRSSNIFHCVIFPLYVAGAHAQSPKRREAVADMVGSIFDDMRFGSVRAIGVALRDVWRGDPDAMSWRTMFGYLSPYAVVL